MTNKTKFILFGLFAFFLASCKTDNIQELDQKQWNLVWSDEFTANQTNGIDTTKWTHDIGRGNNGWGNQELEYYTDKTENISLDGKGNLTITARKENFGGASFTSSRIKTQGKFSTKYGKIEARIKCPYGPGVWPAFWMLGTNVDQVGWPTCGEIDIMELKGQEPNVIYGSLHGPGYSAGNSITQRYALINNRFDTDFHTFSIEWNQEKVDYFVDNYLYQRIERSQTKGNWVFDQEFYLILNVAIGGTYVGYVNIDTPFPQTMYIDYVRVYQ